MHEDKSKPDSTPSSESLAIALTSELARECVRRLREESLPRIETCLRELAEDQIWSPPAASVTSVGNLVLHLTGNLRQWLLCGLGEQADDRDRDSEFLLRDQSARRPDKSQLVADYARAIDEAEAVLAQLQPEDLLRHRRVQDFNESGLAICVHVVEHASYHVGQISYWTKILRGVDLGYYADDDLTQRGHESD